MTIKSQTLTKALTIGLCTAALGLVALPASAKHCMHGKGYHGYHAHHAPYGKYHGYGPRRGYGYKHGYGKKPYNMGHGPMYGHGKGMYGHGKGMYGHGTGMYGHGKGMYGSGYAMNYQPKEIPSNSAKKDLVDTAIAAGKFNTLVQAIEKANLKDLLKSDGPYTVFAPTDDAFAKLPAGTLDVLLADKEKLADVLKYHVVPGKFNAADVLQTKELKTAEGQMLPVETIEVAKADIETSNGVIHVVDSVLIPKM